MNESGLMNLQIDQSTVLAIIWFFIGFGAGLALLRFWKVLILVVVLAVLLPFIISLAGVSSPLTPEQVIAAFFNGVNLLASLLASNNYSALGFIVGVILGLLTYALRSR